MQAVQLINSKRNEIQSQNDFDRERRIHQIQSYRIARAEDRREPMALLSYHYKDQPRSAGLIANYLMTSEGDIYEWTEYIHYGDRFADEIQLGPVSLSPDGTKYSLCYSQIKRIHFADPYNIECLQYMLMLKCLHLEMIRHFHQRRLN
jgi:hypothetical protein